MKEKYLAQNIENIGILDIETSGLKADFDFMITYAILVRNVKTGKTRIRKAFITPEDFEEARKIGNPDEVDARILRQLMSDIADIDYLVGHWFIGKKRHDIPFVRTRCAINRISGFPKHKMVRYGDTQRFASQLHRLRSNGLAVVADAYEISTHKTPIKTKDWKKATMFGDPKAVRYILHHNVNDVKITHEALIHLEEYIGISAIYA
jgi:uncharacterized protein YprB with RNaseH-like and TPR domain